MATTVDPEDNIYLASRDTAVTEFLRLIHRQQQARTKTVVGTSVAHLVHSPEVLESVTAAKWEEI